MVSKSMMFVCALMAFFSVLSAWEDHPDSLDFSEQDRLFKGAQKQSGAYLHEQRLLEEKCHRELVDSLTPKYILRKRDLELKQLEKEEHDPT